MSLMGLARVLILLGITLLVVGIALYVMARFGISVGRLPGDIVLRRGNFTIAIPIVTSILLSILLTIGLNILFRLLNR